MGQRRGETLRTFFALTLLAAIASGCDRSSATTASSPSTAPSTEGNRTVASLVPAEDQDRCFNMRGAGIDEWTAPLHRLFEDAAPGVVTIGIGDGGNEIGMGSIPWTELARRLPEPHGGKIACRVPCDWTILAGVSNWGGYALAAAVAYLEGRVEILEPWTGAQQFAWLEAIVRNGPAPRLRAACSSLPSSRLKDVVTVMIT